MNLCEPHCVSEDEVAAGPYQAATGNLNSFITYPYLQIDTDTLLLADAPAHKISVCYTLHVNTHVHIIIKRQT